MDLTKYKDVENIGLDAALGEAEFSYLEALKHIEILYLMVVIMNLIILTLFLFRFIEKCLRRKKKISDVFDSGSVTLIIVALLIVLSPIINPNFYAQEAWDRKYVGAYINSLEREKTKNIIEIGPLNKEYIGFDENNDEKFKADITLMHKGKIKQIRNAKVEVDVPEGKTAYASYVQTDKKLGVYKAGFYNVEIHLPVDYGN